MSIDLAEFTRAPALIALSVVGLFVIKLVIIAGLARAFAFTSGQAVEMGLLLGQAGEFGFVVVALGRTLGLVPEATAQFMFIVIGITMLLTPFMARAARKVGHALAVASEVPAPDLDLAQGIAGHVVIVGYGRTGRLLAELLDRQHIAHVALDLDAARVSALRQAGAPVFLGDGSRRSLLERVHLDSASALAVTMDHPAAALRVVQAARELTKTLPILARARDDAHAGELMAHGASDVVPEVLEAGLHLGQLLLERAGLPSDATREIIELERAKSLQRLVSPTST